MAVCSLYSTMRFLLANGPSFIMVYSGLCLYCIWWAAYSFFNIDSLYSAIFGAKKKKQLDRSYHTCGFKGPRIFSRRFWTGLIVFFYLKEYIYLD